MYTLRFTLALIRRKGNNTTPYYTTQIHLVTHTWYNPVEVPILNFLQRIKTRKQLKHAASKKKKKQEKKSRKKKRHIHVQHAVLAHMS